MELYNLKEDPSEKNDLAMTEKAKTQELLTILEKYMEETKAVLPTKNENFKGGKNFRW